MTNGNHTMSDNPSFTTPHEALAALLERVTSAPTDMMQASSAAGRILAETIITDRPSPAVSVSAMDGFAARLADVQSATRLAIAGEVRIGREPSAMPGSPCVIRIVTGGAVPTGADLVIKREDVAEHGDQIAIEPTAAARLRLGENIRFAGENAPGGKPIAEPGTLISPALAGAIATVGRVHVRVHQPLTIAIISTGDELVDVHEQPTPWQLRDSNGPALAAMFAPCPWVARVSSQRVVDDEPSIDRALQTAVEQADAVLLTGGVSAGHRDFVPGALARAGIQTVFHKLPQRPGRPVLAAVTADGRPVLALPGNPVSVLVTARRLALPAIMRRAGLARVRAPAMVRVINADDRAIPLWWHRPARLSGPGEAMLIDMRSSGDIVGVAMSDGFVELPPQQCGPGPWPYFAWSVG